MGIVIAMVLKNSETEWYDTAFGPSHKASSVADKYSDLIYIDGSSSGSGSSRGSGSGGNSSALYADGNDALDGNGIPNIRRRGADADIVAAAVAMTAKGMGGNRTNSTGVDDDGYHDGVVSWYIGGSHLSFFENVFCSRKI
jgi:hypothetical protein